MAQIDDHPAGANMRNEHALMAMGYKAIAGVDEVGRGPLAGSVTAAAVILMPGAMIKGLADSKTLKPAAREMLFHEIVAKASAVGVGFVTAEEIDASNIRVAALRAMCQAVNALAVVPDFALIDGRDVPPDLICKGQAIVKGDAISASIAAASIVAKVLRDRQMTRCETFFPGYGWGKHMGYGTKSHQNAIKQQGPAPFHRLSFAPFKNGTPWTSQG